MLVAVTGGTGRIGRFTVQELLDHGYQVRNVDREPPQPKKCPFVRADMTDFRQVVNALAGCDAVIHLAAIAGPGEFPSQVIYVNNTISNYNVLEAAALLGIKKVCMASSVNAIGLDFSTSPEFDYFPIDEKHPSRPEDSYGLSKWCGEQQADAFARRHRDMTLASQRYHGVAAPGTYDRWRQQPCSAAEGAKGLWGYTDARDAACANRLAIEATWTGHQAFFITARDTCCEASSIELAKTFCPNVPIAGDLSGRASFFNCSKAGEWLSWEHKHSWRTSD